MDEDQWLSYWHDSQKVTNLVGTHHFQNVYGGVRKFLGVTCMLTISQQRLLQLLVSTIFLFVTFETHQLLVYTLYNIMDWYFNDAG